jgi:hypothetical protein
MVTFTNLKEIKISPEKNILYIDFDEFYMMMKNNTEEENERNTKK